MAARDNQLNRSAKLFLGGVLVLGAISVAASLTHLSSETEAIILEGTAQHVADPTHPLAAPCAAASKAKYAQYYSGDQPAFRPFWALRPAVAYAWPLEGFPRGATRWSFEAAATGTG